MATVSTVHTIFCANVAESDIVSFSLLVCLEVCREGTWVAVFRNDLVGIPGGCGNLISLCSAEYGVPVCNIGVVVQHAECFQFANISREARA